VRNSIILVDFIELRRREGMGLSEAVLDAGEVRFRPMLLTAAALYWAMSILFELLQVRIERYYGRGFAGERREDAAARAQGIALGHH
jgi:hypothetical protein